MGRGKLETAACGQAGRCLEVQLEEVGLESLDVGVLVAYDELLERERVAAFAQLALAVRQRERLLVHLLAQLAQALLQLLDLAHVVAQRHAQVVYGAHGYFSSSSAFSFAVLFLFFG